MESCRCEETRILVVEWKRADFEKVSPSIYLIIDVPGSLSGWVRDILSAARSLYEAFESIKGELSIIAFARGYKVLKKPGYDNITMSIPRSDGTSCLMLSERLSISSNLLVRN